MSGSWGRPDFVELVLAQPDERHARQDGWTRRGMGFEHLGERVAEVGHLDLREVLAEGRQRRKLRARSLLCFWAVRELGLPLTTLARQLGLTPPGVSYGVNGGEALVRENRYQLVS